MRRRRHRALPGLLLSFWIVGLGTSRSLQAAGINTNVALPVREGGFVYRTQLRFLSASDDPTPQERDINLYVVPNVLVYGVTERTTLFGILPYISESVELTSAGSRRESEVHGFGDLTFLLRQTIYARDAVQRTSRLGLIAGLEIPSGKEEFSSHSTDFVLGGVYTLQAGRHELDAAQTREESRRAPVARRDVRSTPRAGRALRRQHGHPTAGHMGVRDSQLGKLHDTGKGLHRQCGRPDSHRVPGRPAVDRFDVSGAGEQPAGQCAGDHDTGRLQDALGYQQAAHGPDLDANAGMTFGNQPGHSLHQHEPASALAAGDGLEVDIVA